MTKKPALETFIEDVEKNYQEATDVVASIHPPTSTVPFKKRLAMSSFQAKEQIKSKGLNLTMLQTELSFYQEELLQVEKDRQTVVLADLDLWAEELTDIEERNDGKSSQELAKTIRDICSRYTKQTNLINKKFENKRKEINLELEKTNKKINACYTEIQAIVDTFTKETRQIMNAKLNLDLSFISCQNN